MKPRKLQFFAKSLVDISLSDSSLVDDEKVLAVISVLKEQYFDTELKKILLSYLSALEKFASQTTLSVEHCGKISDSQISNIKERFEKFFGKRLAVKTINNSDLIAGIRLSIADLVVENSIAGTLNAYRRLVGA